MNTYYVMGKSQYSVFIVKTDMDRDDFKFQLKRGYFKFEETSANGKKVQQLLNYSKKVPRATGSCFKCFMLHEGNIENILYEVRNESTMQTQEFIFGTITHVKPSQQFLQRKAREAAQAAAEQAARMRSNDRGFGLNDNKPMSAPQGRTRTTIVNHHHHYHKHNEFSNAQNGYMCRGGLLNGGDGHNLAGYE